MMKLKNVILIIFCLILCVGCNNTKKTDAIKFKEEYEKYNDSKIKLEIDENNIITYATTEEINKIIKEKTGVIFIGSPKDNLSRTAIKTLLEASDSTDLTTIYYIDKIDSIEGIEEKKTPLVLNVLEGEVISYHTGTINDSTNLSEDDELELYNIYLDGIHEVLQDSCDERC